MKAIIFPEHNTTLKSNDPDVLDLPVFTDGRACAFGFKLSEEELEKIKETGEIWCVLYHPPAQFPPVMITVDKPVGPTTDDQETEKKTEEPS